MTDAVLITNGFRLAVSTTNRDLCFFESTSGSLCHRIGTVLRLLVVTKFLLLTCVQIKCKGKLTFNIYVCCYRPCNKSDYQILLHTCIMKPYHLSLACCCGATWLGECLSVSVIYYSMAIVLSVYIYHNHSINEIAKIIRKDQINVYVLLSKLTLYNMTVMAVQSMY